jgi:hypothetical protein
MNKSDKRKRVSMAIYIMLAVLAILAFLIILGSEIGPRYRR